MNTEILKLDKDDFIKEDLQRAVSILKKGGLVAFPTETVYGLGANALDADASRKIYEAKGRPSDNPLIVHISKMEDMIKLAIDIPQKAYQLAKVFWPGPLTIILRKSDNVPYGTTGGLDTVAIRLPANRIAREIIKQSQIFIAAPSANISGKPSPTKAEHVIEDLYGKVDMIVDGGKATLGLESTIVDLTGETPLILRPGCITKYMLENVIGEVNYDPAILTHKIDNNFTPKAPGMKYRHYAPEGNLSIYEGDLERVIAAINARAEEMIEKGFTVGIIATEETKNAYPYGMVKMIGSRKDEATIAAGLYEILREFDEQHTEYIFSESFSDNKLGHAIMNRLLKAASFQVISIPNA